VPYWAGVIKRIISFGAPTSSKFGLNRALVAVLNRKPAISLKHSKTGPRLLSITNRKLHPTCFRLLPKSTIMEDLQQPLGTLFQNTGIIQSPIMNIHMFIEHMNEDRLAYYQQRRCSPMTLVSGSKRFIWTMDIHGGSLEGASNDSGVVETSIFSAFGHHIFRTFRNKANI